MVHLVAVAEGDGIFVALEVGDTDEVVVGAGCQGDGDDVAVVGNEAGGLGVFLFLAAVGDGHRVFGGGGGGGVVAG